MFGKNDNYTIFLLTSRKNMHYTFIYILIVLVRMRNQSPKPKNSGNLIYKPSKIVSQILFGKTLLKSLKGETKNRRKFTSTIVFQKKKNFFLRNKILIYGNRLSLISYKNNYLKTAFDNTCIFYHILFNVNLKKMNYTYLFIFKKAEPNGCSIHFPFSTK